jgi:dienelactone hydrolase
MRPPAPRHLAVALSSLLVAAGCAATEPTPGAAAPDGRAAVETTSTTAVTTGRPRTVTTLTETFVDPSRPTAPVGTVADPAPERTLPTTIYLPDGEGPGPLIVFSHGLGGSPQKFTGIHQAWAAAGYVVAAPRFPLTSDANPDHRTEVGDLFQQPADISFVLDELLTASAATTGPLAGRIDPERVGAAGLSLGGATTYGLVMNDCCVDPRVRAAVVMAGAVLITTGGNDTDRGVPVLALHGDTDLALPYSLGRSAWESLGGPAWLVTLRGGDHAGPFEDFPTPWDDAVAASTIAFWDAVLGGEPLVNDELERIAARSDGLVVVESR